MTESRRDADTKGMSTITEDVTAALKEISARPVPFGPRRTIHHPNCAALPTGVITDCTCGGWRLPT